MHRASDRRWVSEAEDGEVSVGAAGFLPSIEKKLLLTMAEKGVSLHLLKWLNGFLQNR